MVGDLSNLNHISLFFSPSKVSTPVRRKSTRRKSSLKRKPSLRKAGGAVGLRKGHSSASSSATPLRNHGLPFQSTGGAASAKHANIASRDRYQNGHSTGLLRTKVGQPRGSEGPTRKIGPGLQNKGAMPPQHPIGLTGRALPPRGPPVQPKPQLRISRTYQDIGTRSSERGRSRKTDIDEWLDWRMHVNQQLAAYILSKRHGGAATFPMDAFPKTMSGAAMQAILNDTFNCEKPASNLDKLSYLIYGIPRVTLSTYI